MTRLSILIAVSLASGLSLSAGPPADAQSTPAQPMDDEQIVRAWVSRWNALGSNSASAIDELLALYAPDALHITGPSPDQRGTATYRGHDGIRALASRIAATQERLTYRIETETANEQTAELLHVATGPWNGVSIAIQLVAVYTDRDGGRRWVVPAAGFFQLADGKVRRARVYYADGEKAEVEPEPQPRRRPPA
jgi:SnoaL-like domain